MVKGAAAPLELAHSAEDSNLDATLRSWGRIRSRSTFGQRGGDRLVEVAVEAVFAEVVDQAVGAQHRHHIGAHAGESEGRSVLDAELDEAAELVGSLGVHEVDAREVHDDSGDWLC